MILGRGYVLALATFVALSTGAAFADDYLPVSMTAAQILAHAKSALGKEAKGSYVTVMHSHGGGTDATITTRTFDDGYETTVQDGDFSTAYGTYKDTHWSQNDNGIVRIRTDFRDAEDPNTLAFEHPDDPQYKVRVLGRTLAVPKEFVIELNPPGGVDEYLYYDATTYFLDQDVTFETDRHRHVAAYSDYRGMFGSFRSFHQEYTDGRPQNDTTAQLISVQKSDDASPTAVPTSRPLFDPPMAAPIVLPARFTDDGIVIRATIAGQGLDFLLDSGASSLVIDPGVAHRLGLVPYGKTTDTIGGEIDDSLTHVSQMTIGTLPMTNVAFDISPLDEQVDNDVEIVGLLGCDFIANNIFGINFEKQEVTLYPRATFDPKALGLKTLPVDLDDCTPRVKASFEGIEGSFLIDSGSFSTMVYQNYLNKLPRSTLEQTQPFEAVGGTVQARYMRVDNFRFGGNLFDTADVLVPSESTFDLAQYDGIIGRDALKNYQIYFDYAKQSVYIKPNPAR